MEAKDLRIGNLVNHSVFGNCKITALDYEMICIQRNDEDIKEWFDTIEYRPILLTEEWLLKFEEFTKTDKEGTPCFFNGDNIMLFDRGSYFDAYLHSEYNGNVFFATRLFYVHQLQNFYHSIERQDLTIKE
jgi:hypothetical protein